VNKVHKSKIELPRSPRHCVFLAYIFVPRTCHRYSPFSDERTQLKTNRAPRRPRVIFPADLYGIFRSENSTNLSPSSRASPPSSVIVSVIDIGNASDIRVRTIAAVRRAVQIAPVDPSCRILPLLSPLSSRVLRENISACLRLWISAAEDADFFLKLDVPIGECKPNYSTGKKRIRSEKDRTEPRLSGIAQCRVSSREIQC